ncbi:RNA polymerase sigma factor [Sulfurospirillum barnesii]|uniref:RNA polymerase sigma factor, sigma-70 family n=1 Tax=Sulfurospirillum barnesii (strain ATCC 700032 / DSM 10660 / SES-3) TaxID=760154 RepID=I3XZA9_SULBS|nr:RNA polymerase sigma factor [Sulfurospirillum barnesii]AFL69283.1 RNA polymerase sigma factor, sigma-70 family [Sulfurospirillum barnesii SES-3]
MLKYYNELLYFAQKLIGNKEDARDLIQETYTKAIAIKDRIDIANERAYLYKIVKNLAIKESMGKQKYESVIFEELIHFEESPHPEELLMQEEHEVAFLSVVHALPSRAKQAFILHTVDGYSRKEIASMMGITTNAVEKLIKRASISIEEELAKKGF